MTRLLNCIISYNRLVYLRNTVESLQEYLRLGDLLILDDGSDDPELIDYLNHFLGTDVRVILHERSYPERFRGGLHALQNEALAYALARNYDFLNILHDDTQFVWHDPDILVKVTKIFSVHDDALQVMNLFQKLITKYSFIENERIELHGESCSYHFRPNGVADQGFFMLNRVKSAGFHFLNTEKETAYYWRAKGYKLYAVHSPTLAFIPWPQTIQNGRKVKQWLPIRAMCPPTRRYYKYYLKPLDSIQSARLQARPLEEIPFLEDYSGPWGWRCIYPFWYTRFSSSYDLKQYIRFLAGFWRNGELVIPRLVSSR